MYRRKYLDALKKLAAVFSGLETKDQLRIFFKVVQNDMRYLSDKKTEAYKFCSGFLASQKEVRSLVELVDYRNRLSSLKISSDKERRFAIGLISNLERIAKGKIPLVHFAFDRWQSEKKIGELEELTVFYTYKLLEQPNRIGDKMELIGSGAYFYIYKPKWENYVYKHPKNYLANGFLLNYEYRLSCLLRNSKMASFLPKLYGLDKEYGLKREFIKGKTGNEIIRSGGCNLVQRKQLAKLYVLLSEQEKNLDSILDIHPGNFIWSQECGQWFFIDLGFVPKIGSIYYPKHSFTKYYKKIWLDRLEMIRRFPIRSVDI